MLTVSAVKTRHACYSTADMFVNAMLQLKGRYRPARQKPQLEGGNIVSVDKNVKTIDGALQHSMDVAAGGAGLMPASSTVAEQV